MGRMMMATALLTGALAMPTDAAPQPPKPDRYAEYDLTVKVETFKAGGGRADLFEAVRAARAPKGGFDVLSRDVPGGIKVGDKITHEGTIYKVTKTGKVLVGGVAAVRCFVATP